MALRTALASLTAQLRTVANWRDLALSAVRDCPQEHQMMAMLEHGLLDFASSTRDAQRHLQQARGAAQRAAQVERVLEHYKAFGRSCRNLHDQWSALSSYANLVELTRLGRSRKGEWRGWTKTVIDRLTEAGPHFGQLTARLGEGWEELSDQLLAVRSVSAFVQTGREPAGKTTAHRGARSERVRRGGRVNRC
jgi:hypothetical protein